MTSHCRITIAHTPHQHWNGESWESCPTPEGALQLMEASEIRTSRLDDEESCIGCSYCDGDAE